MSQITSDADVAFAGLAGQAQMLRDRQVSARELTELALRRIEQLDPRVNAFRTVLGESALAEADAAQAQLDAGESAPLLGVPIAIKDNVGVAGQVRANGTKANVTAVAADDEQTRRLRAAGAVIVGLTHLPELAVWPFTESAGWGRTRNPWDTERQTGGSSGGSAAAVAAGMVAAASASDGGGSIRIPAACCGLFGLKPQRGRVSLAPYAEHWRGLSVTGCVTRSVLDTAVWLDVVRGGAPGDAVVAPDPPRSFVEAAQTMPERLRIAVSVKPIAPGPVAKEVKQAVRETADLLRSLGHDVRDHNPPWGLQLPAFLPLYLNGIHLDVEEVEHPERLEQRTRTLGGWGKRIGERGVRFAQKRQRAHTARLGALFDEFDVLLTPTIARPPERSGRWEGKGAFATLNGVARYVPFTTPWNLVGQPAAAVPAGFTADGLPLSVQLVGRADDECTLLSLSAQLEAERPWADRRPPVS